MHAPCVGWLDRRALTNEKLLVTLHGWVFLIPYNVMPLPGRPCVLQNPWEPMVGWTSNNTYLCKALNFRVKIFRFKLWAAMMSRIVKLQWCFENYWVLSIWQSKNSTFMMETTMCNKKWMSNLENLCLSISPTTIPLIFRYTFLVPTLHLCLHFCIGNCWCNA